MEMLYTEIRMSYSSKQTYVRMFNANGAIFLIHNMLCGLSSKEGDFR